MSCARNSAPASSTVSERSAKRLSIAVQYSSATFTIGHTSGALNVGNTATVKVDLAAIGTATGDTDYTDDIVSAIATAAAAANVGFNTTTGVLTFTSASATSFNVTISAINDAVPDSGETVQINLVAGSATIAEGAAAIGTGAASTTITDIDQSVVFNVAVSPTSISEEADTIMDVVEPYLLQMGFLDRTQRGRVVTKAAYDHLGLPYSGPEQPKLL